MTEPTVNPYHPVQRESIEEALEPLRFHGVIERADYQRMLPRGERWLCLVLAVILGMCILVFGPASVLFALSEGKLLVVLGLIAFWTLMLAALWFLKLQINLGDRATRLLKMYPDVLGKAQGELAAGGFSFNDGVQTHWFGPKHLLRTGIRSDGVRVHVDASLHHYLALSARLFDGFDVDSANRLKRHWRKLSETPSPDEQSQGVELWNQLSQPPAEAIHFRGSAETQISLKTPSYRHGALMESGWLLIMTAILIIARNNVETWLFWVGGLLLFYGLITNTLNWWNYFGPAQQYNWYQSGWISPMEFAIYYDSVGVRMPLSQIVHKTEYPDRVQLTLKSGQSYYIFRQMLTNDEQWQRLGTLQVPPANRPSDTHATLPLGGSAL